MKYLQDFWQRGKMMKKMELVNFMTRIKAHYQDFLLDDFKIDEWYEQLKDYDINDLNNKLDNYVKGEFGDVPPKINYLINGLVKTANKGVTPNYIVECPMCHCEVSLERFDDHYARCSAVNYLSNQCEKIYGAKINKQAL